MALLMWVIQMGWLLALLSMAVVASLAVAVGMAMPTRAPMGMVRLGKCAGTLPLDSGGHPYIIALYLCRAAFKLIRVIFAYIKDDRVVET